MKVVINNDDYGGKKVSNNFDNENNREVLEGSFYLLAFSDQRIVQNDLTPIRVVTLDEEGEPIKNVQISIYFYQTDYLSDEESCYLATKGETDKFGCYLAKLPKLALEKKIYHHPISGIWKDIGNPEELLAGNILLMKHLIGNKETDNIIDETAQIDDKVLIYPPIMLGKDVIIKENCILGPNVIIGDSVSVGQNTEIKDSLIYNETEIGQNVTIDRSIIADNCILGDYCDIQGNDNSLVIIASFVEVNPHIRLIASDFTSLTVCHHEVVKESRSQG